MLKEVNWSDDRSYRTGAEEEPVRFYLDGLCNSKNFDLLLGYFSSAAINVLSVGFATFLYSGGKMRLVVNNILSRNDKDAIKAGQGGNASDIVFDLSDIKHIKRTLDEYGKHFFECIAWLIANKKIQIVAIQPKDKAGISHFKDGIFYDENDYVSFSGSCNFTANGLLDNFERLQVFLGWENKRSTVFTDTLKKDFEDFFLKRNSIAEYLDVEQIEVAITSEFGNKTIEELLIEEKDLIEKKSRFLQNKKVKKSFEQAIAKIEEIQREPKFPFPSGPRKYQMEAYQNWVNNNYQGIFAMATGTGKTITSLNCVLNEYQKSKDRTYHAVILVPTITLVEQWEKETYAFNFQEVIKVSSKYDWEEQVGTTLSAARRIPTSFIIISTYASFVKDKFQSIIPNLPSDTIFIADEGHNLASPIVLSKLNAVKLEKRIGLSATPKRIYDPEGTKVMEDFFSDSEPYTFSFTMDRAIREGILCKYYYYPHIVKLTEEELKEYIEISRTLSKFYNSRSNSLDGNEIVERLLLKRKRIIHKAANKLNKTKAILREEYVKRATLKYTFIYVPEGITEEIPENDTGNVEEIKLINQYTREIGKINERITVNQFISGMPDRNEILRQFQDGHIQVIASMKCLDEGVDIPRAEQAIFCSSTGNPRQFIQRRGRILRRHPDKNQAIIHDLVVIPDYTNSQLGTDTYNIERNMIKTELQRVMYFASLSINPYFTEEVFTDACYYYGLNIYTIQSELQNV